MLINSPEITYRHAHPFDVSFSTPLLHLTEGVFADHFFGFGDRDKAQKILSGLFSRNKNRFSYQFTTLAEVAEVLTGHRKLAGIIVAYPANQMKQMEIPTARHLFSLYGLVGMMRFLLNARHFLSAKEAESDEYFINSLAVSPQYQGKGIGTALLDYAEKKAKAEHFHKNSLWVARENTRARILYERNGYKVKATFGSKKLYKYFGCLGFHRMVKNLG